MKKICKLCGKEFETTSGRKTVCDNDHFTECIICGNKIKIKYASNIPKTCSPKCRMELMRHTCEEKYGSRDPGNLPKFREKSKQTCLKRYGVDNPSKSEEVISKIKSTWLEKYGVENVSQLDSHKEQVSKTWQEKSDEEIGVISERRRKTCQERYDVDHPMQSKEIQKRVQQTDLKRYGVLHHITAKEVRIKSDKTKITKYGTIYPTQLESIQNKRRQTCMIKYGVEHPLKSKELIEKLRIHYNETLGHWPGQDVESISKRKQTNIDRYGVPAAFLLPENQNKARDSMLKSGHRRISKINLEFQKLLECIGISSTLEYRIENKFYDICILDKKIVIEIDPTWTHCSEGNMYDDLDKNYHRDKSKIAQRNGFHCIHVFDWDDWDKIISIISDSKKVYARNCELVYLDHNQCDLFLQLNHLQGTVSGQIACLGLVYENKLIEIMTFGNPRYNKNYQWELLRLATQSGYKVVGGASKLFKHFVDDIHPDSIVTYCNLSKFTGEVYEKLGFKHVRNNAPNIWWCRGEKKVISDTLLNQRGYDQLFGTNYGKGTSNHDLMMEHYWRPIYDCGQAVYEWIK